MGWAYESTGREYLGYADSFLGVEGWLERFAREAKGIGVRFRCLMIVCVCVCFF